MKIESAAPIVTRVRVTRWFRLFRNHSRSAYQAASLARYFAANRRRQIPAIRGPLAA